MSALPTTGQHPLPQRVLVIGATGMLGRPVVTALLNAGVDVRALVRDPSRAATQFGPELARRVEFVAGDVLEPATLTPAMSNCQAVHISLSGGLAPRRTEQVEHLGTRAVAQAAADAGVEHLTYLSGGSTADTPLGDDSHLPMTSIAKSRAEAAIRDSGVPWTALRATMFAETLAKFVRGSTAVVFTPAPTAFHWIAASDYADLVVRVLGTPATRNNVLHVHGPQALTLDQALGTFRLLLAPDLRIRHLPTSLLTAAGVLTRNPRLTQTARAMRMLGTGHESGDPSLTHRLVGPLTTTFEQWCTDTARQRTHSR